MEKRKITRPETRNFKLKLLNPAPYNPRKIKRENKDGLGSSMVRFGCVQDIIVNVRDNSNIIVGGHQRYDILVEQNGIESEWPCKAVDLSPEDEKALNLVLNNPHLQGAFTDDLPEHILAIREQLKDDMAFMQLRLDQLSTEISEKEGKSRTDGEVEFSREVLEENNYIVFLFDNKIDWQAAKETFGLKTVQALDSKEGYRKAGTGRVLSGSRLMQVINGENPDDFYSEL